MGHLGNEVLAQQRLRFLSNEKIENGLVPTSLRKLSLTNTPTTHDDGHTRLTLTLG